MRSVVFLRAESGGAQFPPAGGVGGGGAPPHFVSNDQKNPFSPP